MDIVRLEAGRPAPRDSDCISVERLPGGSFHLTGSVLAGEESMALLGEAYESRELAEERGVAWAQELGVPLLYVASNEG